MMSTTKICKHLVFSNDDATKGGAKNRGTCEENKKYLKMHNSNKTIGNASVARVWL